MTIWQVLYVVTGFGLQLVLILHFALRRWRFATAAKYGPLVYALAIPATLNGLYALRAGADWFYWLAGFLYLAWGVFGCGVEYAAKVSWRAPFFGRLACPIWFFI